ncbi:MAG: prolipoprotein diacylglyceryl transferase [Chloroflexi bacterium]|nr:prolipoprotein diacylglyceryl transferase [Chloroflexota bacterium]
MINIGIDPIIFRLGPFSLSWHSLFTMVAMLVSIWLTVRLARSQPLVNTISSLAPWAILGGIVGARLVHVVDYWSVYAANPAAIFAVWEGGLALWGGILGGTLAALVYGKLTRTRIAVIADLAAPGLILAQAIGRIGDIINGEHFSTATDLPWGVVYTHPNSPAYGLPPAHPEVAYELLMDLLIFGLLWKLRGRVGRDGNLFLVYLAAYSFGRFLFSFLRLDSNTVFLGLNQAQWISLSVLGIAVPILFLRQRRGTP